MERASSSPASLCSQNTSKVVPIPLEHKCPSACPFSQHLTNDHCHKVCITADLCRPFYPAKAFASVEAGECVGTCGSHHKDIIVGCSQCKGVGVCEKCATGFFLSSDGKRCIDHMGQFWTGVYWTIGIVVVLLLWYMNCLSRRENINPEVLQHSLLLRDRRKCWNWQNYHERKHSLFSTNCALQDISGQGVQLYFRFLHFSAAVAFVFMVGAYIAYQCSDLKEHIDRTKADCEVAKLQGHSIARATAAYNGHTGEFDMFLCLVFMYLAVIVVSMVFVYKQYDTSYRWDENNATHKDYAVLASGLPATATDPLELCEFFQKELQAATATGGKYPQEDASSLSVIGVSICYDYKEHQDCIEDAVQDWIEELEVEIGRRNWKGRPPEHHEPPNTARRLKGRSCTSSLYNIVQLKFLDYFFWGSCSDETPPDTSTKEESEQKLEEVLTTLQGSGKAYVIVSAPKVVQIMRDVFKGENAPLFDSNNIKTKVKVRQVLSEPSDIYWANFSEMNFWPRIVLGTFLMLGTIVLWLALYLPYAISYSNYVKIPGVKPGEYEDLLLGLLIAVGNAIVSQVVDVVTRWAGFRHKDRRDIAILSLAFLATLLNTACDIWMVMMIAQGAILAEEVEGVVQRYDMVIAREMMSLIVPGYLILPYLVTPLFEHILPYLMGRWFIRSKNVSLRQAEDCIACPDFDICWRYSDTLNNFTICLLFFIFVTPNSYKVMAWLIVFIILIVLIDKYKLLRQTTQTFYTTRRLETAVQIWWVVPTGIFACITTWWGCKCGLIAANFTYALVGFSFFVHAALYFACWTFTVSLVPEAKQEETTFNKMHEDLYKEGKVWSYFNTNPVFCLRSKYLKKQEPAGSLTPRGTTCIPYMPGKQFLYPGLSEHYHTNPVTGSFSWNLMKKASFGLLGDDDKPDKPPQSPPAAADVSAG